TDSSINGVVFFFSSRRRHTISLRDWSSDVCSSDLVGTNTIGLDIGPSSLASVPQQGPVQLQTFCEELRPNARKKRRLQRKMARRSEERRVGKSGYIGRRSMVKR